MWIFICFKGGIAYKNITSLSEKSAQDIKFIKFFFRNDDAKYWWLNLQIDGVGIYNCVFSE